jgi:uncharacterized protein (TIGR04255 family)
MSATLAQDGHFEPIHAAHAIEQVVFVVQFDTALDDHARFSEIRIAAMEFKSGEDLPGEVPIQEFSIAVKHPDSAVPPPLPSSFVLRSVARDGMTEQELMVERASLTFKTSLYSHWGTAWAQAKRYFERLVPLYVQNSQVRAISLNYVDKFVWDGDASECNPSLLFVPKSKYVCPHVFETREFWHSHTGKFIRASGNVKRLLNVNVDYLEETTAKGSRRVVSITTVLTDMLNQPNYSPTKINSKDALDFVDNSMEDLHVFGKEVLREIICPEMSKRIALIG